MKNFWKVKILALTMLLQSNLQLISMPKTGFNSWQEIECRFHLNKKDINLIHEIVHNARKDIENNDNVDYIMKNWPLELLQKLVYDIRINIIKSHQDFLEFYEKNFSLKDLDEALSVIVKLFNAKKQKALQDTSSSVPTYKHESTSSQPSIANVWDKISSKVDKVKEFANKNPKIVAGSVATISIIGAMLYKRKEIASSAQQAIKTISNFAKK